MVAMMVASALPGFAAPSGPGPNSFEAFDQGALAERANFGQCQQLMAKLPGQSGSTAEEDNPSFGNDPDKSDYCVVSRPG